jgi:carnitine 3-dehydrogenase
MPVSTVKTLGLLGTGVIGAGWAARALHFGVNVIAVDAKPGMETWLRSAVANAEPALARLITAPLPPKGQFSFTTDVMQMARAADFIQENVPEQLELKQRVLGDVSRHTRPGVIIASSTSGLMPSDLQRSMQSPERFCVAHPFNPVYLLPLVEIVGGELTSAATLQVASDFFRFIGMHPLRVRKEIPGHLTDRLQEALWREILHMVNDGVATTGELDESIIYGPGLRWAGMGTNLIYHLAGGESGTCLKWPWTKLEAPELTAALIDRMVEGTQQQAAGRSIRELERLRDDYLVAIQQVLRRYNVGAGATLRALEDRLFADASRAAQRLPHDQSGPTRVLATQVRPEWIDYNGHMTESRYLQVFGDATDALFVQLGADAAYRATGRSFFAVETHITHQLELNVSESLYVTTQILGFDARRLHIFHRMHRAHDAALVATAEHMQLHVDSNVRRTAPMGPEVQAQVERLAAAHATLSPPPERGRTIGLKQVG